MELLDLVDDNDTVVGTIDRDEVHAAGALHRIVHVLVYNRSGELGLQRRSMRKDFCPGCWVTSAGGFVKSGETYEQAAARELFGELGIRAPLTFERKDLFERNGYRKFLTTFRADSDGPFRLNRDEVDGLSFFPVSVINEMTRDETKFHPELLFLLKRLYAERESV